MTQVPILLLLMAGLIKLPNLVWRVFSLGSGLDLNQLNCLVISTQCATSEKYRESVKHIAGQWCVCVWERVREREKERERVRERQRERERERERE